MKKGDIIQKRREIVKGESLFGNLSSLEEAKQRFAEIPKYYNLPSGVLLEAGYDELNSGRFAVIAGEDTYVTIEAEVMWVVENEVSIKFPDTGAYKIIDLSDEDEQGWVVTKSAVPTYQSDVEHMSDEELRASIDGLRHNRIATPPQARRKKKTAEPKMSEEDKKLTKVLAGMSDEAKLALQKKLGLVE